MKLYMLWVQTNPMFSAFLQFAVLGTLGEIISHTFRSKHLQPVGNFVQTLATMLAWGILGIVIKLGFVGMKGAVRELILHHYLPEAFLNGWGWAFSVSVITNLFFGPQMMFFHRIEENIIHHRWNMEGLTTAFKTLIWFWIPAHTITFILPVEFQIGLAALWSIVLGVILGITAPSANFKMENQEQNQIQTIPETSDNRNV